MERVTTAQLRHTLRGLGLQAQSVCVHSSLRSFGHVQGGPDAIITALLAEQCTLLVPTFSWSFAVPVPATQQLLRNGWDYAAFAGPTSGLGRVFTPACPDIDADMGALSRAVLAHPAHHRGDHPLCSFTALGSRAAALVDTQTPVNVYAPLDQLVAQDGTVILMGVDLTACTLLHRAEQRAGRTLFRRWANDRAQRPMAVSVGGCSAGFGQLAGALRFVTRTVHAGASTWTVLPARAALERAVSAIWANPDITRCAAPGCLRCHDAIAGGPLL